MKEEDVKKCGMTDVLVLFEALYLRATAGEM